MPEPSWVTGESLGESLGESWASHWRGRHFAHAGVRHGVVRVEDALAVVGARAEGRHAVRGGGPRESREAARSERVAEREVHVRPARAYGENKADLAGQARPKRVIGRGWPKIRAAWCTIWRQRPPELPAGRGLGHLTFHRGSRSVTLVYPRLGGERLKAALEVYFGGGWLGNLRQWLGVQWTTPRRTCPETPGAARRALRRRRSRA